MKGFLIGLGIFVITAIMIAVWWIGVSNTEIRLRNKGNAQQESCNAFFDKMWKVLQQKAQVTDQYKEAFEKIYPEIIAGRYSGQNDGSLMKWVTESNPQFDISLYKDLMDAIEGQRESFLVEQQKLIDIQRQHNDMRMTFPKSLVLGDREPFVPVIIKSSRTNKAVETGKDDDVDLYQKKG